MTQKEPPKIEFPCDYPIKVIADNHEEARGKVLAVMEQHAAPLAEGCVTERLSREGRFMSLTVTIVATGKDQLERIHVDLKATGVVKMVM